MRDGNTPSNNSPGQESTGTNSAQTITVRGVSYKVIGQEHCHGRDIVEGTYTVVEFQGSRRAVIQETLRSFAARGVGCIRALQTATSTQHHKGTGDELPENAVILTAKTIKILTAIQAACGADTIAEVIESSLPALASANLISDALYERLVARVEKTVSTQG